MSMYGFVERDDGGYKRSSIDVLDKTDIEKIIDDKLIPINDKINDITGESKSIDGIQKMIINEKRSKLYSIYYFTTGDPTNLAHNQVEIEKTVTVPGSGGRNTQVTDKHVITQVSNWYNCSRYSISDDNSDNTLFLTTGGESGGGVTYTRIKNKGYMKDCLMIDEGKNLSTLFGVKYYDEYSFYFSFRTFKPNDEIFYFNHEGVLGVFTKRKEVEKSGSGGIVATGYVNQLFVSVFDKSIKVIDSVFDGWFIISVTFKDDSAIIYLNGTKVGSVKGGFNRPSISKPGIMISGTTYVSDIVLFNDYHDEELVEDISYWLKNI